MSKSSLSGGFGVAHPHLYFRAEDLPAIRAKTRHPRFRDDWAKLLAQAEAHLGLPLVRPEEEDNRLEFCIKRSAQCAFVGLVSGERRFMEYAHAGMSALLASPDWTIYKAGNWDARFGQTASHLAMELGFLYDLLAPEMPERERRALVEMSRAQLVEAFLGDCRLPERDHLFGARTMNHSASRSAGAGVLCLALDGDGVDLSRELEIARAHSLRFIEWYDEAGGAAEINGYWAYGMGSTLKFLAALRANGFPKIFRQRSCKLQRTAYPLMYFSICGKTVANFTDSVYGPISGWGRANAMMLAAEFRDQHLQWFADQTVNGGEMSMIFGDPELPATAPDDLPTSVAYHGCGVGVMRSSMTDPDALFLGLRGGRARGTVYDDPHCQFDLNSVILDAFGESLLADPGYLHKNWDSGSHLDPNHISNSTPPHNTLLVDGAGQLHQYNPIAHLQDLSPDGDVDYIVSRVEQGYGPKVRLFDRHAYMVNKELFVLVDDVELTGPGTLTWNFHGAKGAKISAGDLATIGNGKAELAIIPFGTLDMKCRSADDHVLPRLEWSTSGGVASARVGWLLLVRRKGGEFPKATAKFEDGGVALTNGNRRRVLPIVRRRAGWHSDVMLPFSGRVSPDVSRK